MKAIAVVAAAGLVLSGCATRAASVAPVSISASDYSGLSCQEVRDELQTARVKEDALASRQNNAAVADAASVFLFLLPLGSVFGADVSGQLAQAKGETLALERQVRGCNASAARAHYATPVVQADPAVPASAPMDATAASPIRTQASRRANTCVVNDGFVSKIGPCAN